MKNLISIQAVINKCVAILSGCLLLFALNSCGGEDDQEDITLTGLISGKVVDASTNMPIRASVELFPNEISCTTDEAGKFKFHDLTPGSYQVIADADGYDSGFVNVNVNSGLATTCTIYLTPASNPNPNPNPDTDPKPTEDYSSAEITCELADIDVELISCRRKSGNFVELVYTMTNTDMLHKQGVTLNNVNAFTNHTQIADNLGNQYPKDQVMMSLAGKDFGYGNNIEGTLLEGIPAKVVITVKAVDPKATKMNYYIYTSVAKAGGVNYTSDVILRNVNIY